MGWLRKRFGESNTALGAGLIYMAARAAFPAHGIIIDSIAASLGVGFVVTPRQP